MNYFLPSYHIFPLLLSVAVATSFAPGVARAQDGSAPANATIDTAPAAQEAEAEEEEQKVGLTVGADLYYGTSNADGNRRYRDGFWLGSGPTFPSHVYGSYLAKDGTTAKVSLSLGKLYNGSFANNEQPIEAYVSRDFGGVNLTAGKFYVPFELAEWEYETALGVQAIKDWGSEGSLTAAVTRNGERQSGNGYLRYARPVGPATVGVSLGVGRGFSFDMDHDRGAALDLTVEQGAFTLESAAMVAKQKGLDSKFGFAFARLNYQATEKAKVYVARHSWSDRLDQQGNGHFSTLGASYQINKNFAVESALSRSGDQQKNIRWVQVHYTVER